MSVKILTDSACDLSQEIIEEYSIQVLPLTVINNEKEYLDQIDISSEEVYSGMRDGKTYSTAQVGPKILLEKFTEYAKTGETAIYICLSSGLSGLYQTAKLIRDNLKSEYPNLDLEIIDSKSATCGMGLIVYEAARMAKNEKNKEEIVERINYNIKHIKHLFSVEEMKYLYKGGRINSIQALAGGLLSIRPILEMNNKGQLVYQDKVRGNKKLFKKMINIMKEDGITSDFENQTIGMVYGDNLESIEEIKSLIQKEINPKGIIVHKLGTTVAAHTGPGIIGITYLKK